MNLMTLNQNQTPNAVTQSTLKASECADRLYGRPGERAYEIS